MFFPYVLVAAGAWWLLSRRQKALALPSGAPSGSSPAVATTDGRTVTVRPRVDYRFQLLLPELSEVQREALGKSLAGASKTTGGAVSVSNVEVRPAKAPYLGSTAVVMTYRSTTGMDAPKTIGGTLDVGKVPLPSGAYVKPVARIKCIERLDGKPIG